MPFPERNCVVCEKAFQPRTEKHVCCTSACRNKKLHNPEAEHKIIHCKFISRSEKPPVDTWAITYKYGMYLHYPLYFRRTESRNGRIQWPRDDKGRRTISVVGVPFPKSGLERVHRFLQPMIEKWIAENHEMKQRAIISPEELERAKLERVKRKISQIKEHHYNVPSASFKGIASMYDCSERFVEIALVEYDFAWAHMFCQSDCPFYAEVQKQKAAQDAENEAAHAKGREEYKQYQSARFEECDTRRAEFEKSLVMELS